MKNKKLFNAIVKISLLSTILAMSFQVLPTNAAALLSMSDTMSRLMTGIASDHAIKFTTPTGAAEGDTIILTFSADFVMGAVDYTDIEVKDDTASLTDAADCTGTEKAGIAVGANAITITICAGDGGAINANSVVDVLVGLNASGGNAQVTNGAADDDDTIAIGGTFGDTGTITVDIVANDQVVITATIDPTFTFTISSNSCALGTLTVGSVATCNYYVAVGTNATGGAVITVQDIDDGDGTTGLDKDGAPSEAINAIAENSTVTAGTEGYGVAIAGGTAWTEVGDFNDDDTPLPTAITTLVSTAAPVEDTVANRTTVTHRAAIDSMTEAGTYSQTLRYIATGTF
jgi:hypothetical protein